MKITTNAINYVKIEADYPHFFFICALNTIKRSNFVLPI